MTPERALEIAVAFHAAYETLAPSYGYETRKDTREFDPATSNGRLMLAVCAIVGDQIATEEHRAALTQAAEACRNESIEGDSIAYNDACEDCADTIERIRDKK